MCQVFPRCWGHTSGHKGLKFLPSCSVHPTEGRQTITIKQLHCSLEGGQCHGIWKSRIGQGGPAKLKLGVGHAANSLTSAFPKSQGMFLRVSV